MREDLDNHGRLLDGGNNLQGAATLPAMLNINFENALEQPDLRPIAEAPKLEELVLIDMRHLSVNSLKCFRDHPTLKAAAIGLGSQRRNTEVATLLGRAAVTDAKPMRQYVEL